jgi:hypothetical protein
MSGTKQTRKGHTPINVWVTPDEKASIAAYARQSGQSASAYLRLLGLGYAPKSLVDHREVERLAKINGDLGRLGGLLKLWLTNDVRTAQYGEPVIRAVLDRILDTQAKMLEVMKLVVMPRANL